MFISSRVMCDGSSTGPGCLVIVAGLPAANRLEGGAKMIHGAMATPGRISTIFCAGMPGDRSSQGAVAHNGSAGHLQRCMAWENSDDNRTTGQPDVPPYKR